MNWARVEEILDEAVRRPANERHTFVESLCGDDPGVIREVKLLLDAGDRATGFFDRPSIDQGVGTMGIGDEAGALLGVGPSGMVGRYKILQQIGEGGFGMVYMAEQLRPVRRRIALKILKPGVDTKHVLARFEAERQAIALMDHPNIATVLDAGETESGRPYFAMELVRGDSITAYCDHEGIPTVQRLELFQKVCSAVQHAHMRGVIHRDIKPSNIIVGTVDGVPVPKVIDFGVAKATSFRLTERTLFTVFRQLIGTPEYMSPEQADTSSLVDVDTRTDVYSLGVLLYELLTGAPPFPAQQLREAGYGEMLRIIRETEPPKPSTRLSTMGDAIEEVARCRREQPGKLGTMVRGELDWIVMKAMEKDRGRRYGSAEAFGDDVGRYLADDAVMASPPSAVYRTRKFARRNRAAVLSVVVVLAVLVLGVIGTTSGLFWALDERAVAREAEGRAVENEMEARESAFEALMLSAGQAKRDGKYAESAGLLDQIREDDRAHWWRVARANTTMTSERLSARQARLRWNADHSLVSALFHGDDHRLEIRDGETLGVLRTMRPADGEEMIGRVKWTTEPDVLVVMDGTPQLVDARTLRPAGPVGPNTAADDELRPLDPGVIGDRYLCFANVRGDDLRLVVHDLKAGRLAGERLIPGLGTLSGPPVHAGGGWFWCFNDAGGPVIAARATDLEQTVVIDGRTPWARRPWTPDQGVVLRHEGRLVECWWVDEHGTPAYGWTFPTANRVTGYQVRDGVAIIKARRTVHLIDVATGRQLTDPIDTGSAAKFVDLDLEGGRLLVDVAWIETRLVRLDQWRRPHSATISKESGRSMRLSPDGRFAVCTNWDPHFLHESGGVRVIDPVCGVELARLMGPAKVGHPVAIDPSGTLLAAVGQVLGRGYDSRTVQVWSLRSGRRLWLRGGVPAPWGTRVKHLRFGDDGSTVHLEPWMFNSRTGEVLAGAGRAAESSDMRNLGTTEPGRSLDVRYIGLGRVPAIEVERRDTGVTVSRFESAHSFKMSSRISHDETRIAIPQRLVPVEIREIETGRLIGALPEYTTDTMTLAWSPDDAVLATAGEDAVIRLWDTETLELLGVLAGHTKYVQTVLFAPDGRSLYSLSGDGTFRVWNDRTPAEQARFAAARRAVYDRLRPAIERIVDGSVDEDAGDAWAALERLGLEGEDAEVGELLLMGTLLTRFGG